MSFQIGDKVAHPMYGAGVLESVVQKKVGGVVQEYYIMKLAKSSMIVMIPTQGSEEIGVRPVVDPDQADRVLAAIPSIQVEMTANWNRRYRENMERLKSGDPAGGGPGGQGPDPAGRQAQSVHGGAEDAPLRPADLDLGAGAVQKPEL